jgi:hypothetical protein
MKIDQYDINKVIKDYELWDIPSLQSIEESIGKETERFEHLGDQLNVILKAVQLLAVQYCLYKKSFS